MSIEDQLGNIHRTLLDILSALEKENNCKIIKTAPEESKQLFLSEKEVSARYSLSIPWLQRARWAGDGIPYVKINRKVLYDVKTIDEWFSQRKTKNTSA